MKLNTFFFVYKHPIKVLLKKHTVNKLQFAVSLQSPSVLPEKTKQLAPIKRWPRALNNKVNTI